ACGPAEREAAVVRRACSAWWAAAAADMPVAVRPAPLDAPRFRDAPCLASPALPTRVPPQADAPFAAAMSLDASRAPVDARAAAVCLAPRCEGEASGEPRAVARAARVAPRQPALLRPPGRLRA